MSLETFQHTLKNLLMSPEGKEALTAPEKLRLFIEKAPLTDPEKQTFLAQPLARYEQYDYMLLANVVETLESIFPFTQKVLGDRWEAVSSDYFWKHPNPSYKLMLAGEAFPDYLETQDHLMAEYPFLAELALYEWVEAELLSAANPQYPDGLLTEVPETAEALETMTPVLNESSILLQFSYPIPAIVEALKTQTITELSPNLIQPKTTMVFVYRTTKPYNCRFFELNPLLAAWLSKVQESSAMNHPASYQETLAPLLAELRQLQPQIQAEQFYQEFLTILKQLYEKAILLGSVSLASD
jgi:hypothetical protein